MGSLQLECPLCCTDTFDDIQSLKYHLLSIIDNILCPACGERCETILELAEHIDQDCGKTDEKKNVEFLQIKIENDDSSENINNSILAKALLNQKNVTKVSTDIKTNPDDNLAAEKNGTETQVDGIEAGEGETEVEAGAVEEEVYSCLGCGMSFTNIVEHIQEHHDGEEVIVEMSENAQDNGKDNSEILKSLSDGSAMISDENIILTEWQGTGGEEDDEMTSQSTDSQEVLDQDPANRSRFPQLLNTIKQEDCVDKDGRLYTRKVVQIEKFWDDKNPNKNKDPVVVKYISDADGTLTKLEEGEELMSEGMEVVEIYQCSVCNVQFHKLDQFNNHGCEPEIGSEYKCSMCESSFSNSQSLCAHMKSHKKAKNDSYDLPTGPFICKVCDTEFATNKSLRLHRRMHDPIKAKEIEPPVQYGLTGSEPKESKPREMFDCKVCGKSYDKSYEGVHMAYHSGENFYDCHICNRKFYTHSNLEMHMRVHGAEKGHLCKHCKKGFLTEESLEQHLKQHCSTRPYQCSYCSRRFARPHEKVKHERIHTGEKPHECEICGKTFRVSYCLTLHMRTHSGYRPYVCQHCGKRFKAHSVYNHHLLTHSDVRNYKCPYCPKAFKTGVQLAGHKNSHIKPFRCTVCNRPFASLYAVRAHMDTHTRENNLKYNCYLCGASYARAFALRDHIKEVHVDEPQNENIALDIIEEGYEASTSILPDNDDISMVTLEMETTNDVTEVTEIIEEESSAQ